MARKCRPIIIDEPAGDEEIWARNFITDLMEIIQPPLNSQEARPLKRTRAGLSVEEPEAREAYKLMKEEKRKEIYESSPSME
jgi:hypothetical protein